MESKKESAPVKGWKIKRYYALTDMENNLKELLDLYHETRKNRYVPLKFRKGDWKISKKEKEEFLESVKVYIDDLQFRVNRAKKFLKEKGKKK